MEVSDILKQESDYSKHANLVYDTTSGKLEVTLPPKSSPKFFDDIRFLIDLDNPNSATYSGPRFLQGAGLVCYYTDFDLSMSMGQPKMRLLFVPKNKHGEVAIRQVAWALGMIV